LRAAFITILVLATVSLCRPKILSSANSPAFAAIRHDRIDFGTEILPVFKKNCTPCHFPGGKMYVRMPFDKDTTILAHQPGILRRIKNVDELNLLRTYLEQQKSYAENSK
jgi:hypothetical protein